MSLAILTATPQNTAGSSHMEELAEALRKRSEFAGLVYLRNTKQQKASKKNRTKAVRAFREVVSVALGLKDIRIAFIPEIQDASAVLFRGGINIWLPVPFLKLMGRTVFYEVDAPLTEDSLEVRNRVFPRLTSFLERVSLRVADRVIVVSDEIRDVLDVNHTDRRILVIPNGVPESSIRSQLSEANGPLKVVYMGTFHEWHGVRELCEAVRKGPETIEWIFIGDGEHADNARAMASHKENVRFYGWVKDQRLIDEILCDCHVGIATYQEIDGFYFSPLKLFRYMANGLACVATRQGQIEKVLSGGTGLLIEQCSADSILEAVLKLDNDREELDRLRRRSIERVRNYTWERNAMEISRELASIKSIESFAVQR